MERQNITRRPGARTGAYADETHRGKGGGRGEDTKRRNGRLKGTEREEERKSIRKGRRGKKNKDGRKEKSKWKRIGRGKRVRRRGSEREEMKNRKNKMERNKKRKEKGRGKEGNEKRRRRGRREEAIWRQEIDSVWLRRRPLSRRALWIGKADGGGSYVCIYSLHSRLFLFLFIWVSNVSFMNLFHYTDVGKDLWH